jgi:FSR family fosmidomycin resistance protein-like MFS transporter
MVTTALQKTEVVDTPAKVGIHKLGLGAIFLAHMAVDMQTSSLAVLLPALLVAFNLNYGLATGIISANNIVIAIAQPLFGTLGDYRKARWLVPLGCAVCGIAMVSVLFMPSYALIIVAVILSGLGSAAFHPEALSATRAVSGEQQTTGSSIFFFAGNLGFSLGPLAAALLLERAGTVGTLWMFAPIALGVAALWVQWPRYAAWQSAKAGGIAVRLEKREGASPTPPSGAAGGVARAGEPPVSRRKTLGVVGFLLLFISVRLLVSGGLTTFVPLYFTEYRGLSEADVAPLLSVLAISGTVGTLFSGPLADRIGRRTVIVATMALSLVGLYVFAHTTGLMQVVALALSGVMLSAPWTLSVIMMQEALPRNVGLASGLSLGTAYGAMGLGVALLGNVADHFGLPFTMQLITWLPAVVLVMGLFAPERK